MSNLCLNIGNTAYRLASITSLTMACLMANNIGAWADDTFKLGVEQKNYRQDDNPYSSPYSYPGPQMIPIAPLQGRAIRQKAPADHPTTSKTPTITGGVVTKITLPPAFLGIWSVQGVRQRVEAMPEFQQVAESAFALNNSQLWTIRGNANAGYTLISNTGIETQLVVDRVEGTTAFIRYQHPVNNTVAQEAIVMSLVSGGAQFNGLERISIVKQGLPQPRAKVTYQLAGHRQ